MKKKFTSRHGARRPYYHDPSVALPSAAEAASEIPGLTAESIVSLVRELTPDAPEQREFERVRPFEGKQELEVKTFVLSLKQVREIVERIKKEDLSKVRVRRERHHVYARNANEFFSIITHEHTEAGKPWIRSKKKGIYLKTSANGGIVALLRPEEKLNAEQDGQHYYDMLHTLTNPGSDFTHVGDFDKTCVDISFWQRDQSYTMTFSLAETDDKRFKNKRCFQAELEYAGHKVGTPALGTAEIFKDLEKTTHKIFSGYKLDNCTKIHWLGTRGGDGVPDELIKVIPEYRDIDKFLSSYGRKA